MVKNPNSLNFYLTAKGRYTYVHIKEKTFKEKWQILP